MNSKKVSKIALGLFLSATISFFTSIPVAAENVQAYTPIHKYTFDSDIGTTVVDSGSVGGQNGTAVNATVVTGYNEVGNARYFDGNSYITFNDSTDRIVPLGAKSIRFKIKTSTVPTTSNMIVMDNSSGDTQKYGIYANLINSPGGYEGCIYFGSCAGVANDWDAIFRVYSTFSVCDGEWHDILFVWDGTTNIDGVKLYVDDMTIPNATSTAKSEETIRATHNLSFGATSNSVAGKFIGSIDDVEIYNQDISTKAPLNLTATEGNAKVTLTWDAAEGATGYNVMFSTQSGGPYETIASAVYGTTYTHEPLINDTTYYYVVSAINAAGESAPSNEVSATPFVPIVAPSAPANLVATAGDSRVDLSWNATESAATYSVKRSTTAGGPYETVASAVYDATTYTDTTVINDTTYYYVVIAVNTKGESDPSNEASATPREEEQPSSGKIMLKTDDGLIYSGVLIEQTSSIFKLKNVYLYNGIPSFISNNQPAYNWEISFYKDKVIWFYFDK